MQQLEIWISAGLEKLLSRGCTGRTGIGQMAHPACAPAWGGFMRGVGRRAICGICGSASGLEKLGWVLAHLRHLRFRFCS